MSYTTLISAKKLERYISEPSWVILDCRFSLANPDSGRLSYQAGHIPGAIYLDLKHDLSGKAVKGVTGRHPLPEVEAISSTFSACGIDDEVQVVAYDDVGGALAAARAWWLLRWLGHEQVAVLNGGIQQWEKAGFMLNTEDAQKTKRAFTPHVRPDLVVSTSQVEAMRQDADYRVCDARSAERFRGENETIDPLAGHIPGAVSLPYAGNLKMDGTFRLVNRLHDRYQQVLGDAPAERVVFYCGSGVTSAHNILAMMVGGLGEAKLYAGSWSEWITDANRAIAVGG